MLAGPAVPGRGMMRRAVCGGGIRLFLATKA